MVKSKIFRNAYRTFSFCASGLVMVLSSGALADTHLGAVSTGPQSPAPLNRGNKATYTVTVSKTGIGDLDAYLSAVGLPSGASAAFSPSVIHFRGSVFSQTATMTVSTTTGTPPGPNPFKVVAEDGGSHNFQTNAALLDITLTSQGLARMACGGVCVALNGHPGTSCCLQATDNLAAPSWTTLCATNSGTNSLMVFFDMGATNYSARFYRLSTP